MAGRLCGPQADLIPDWGTRNAEREQRRTGFSQQVLYAWSVPAVLPKRSSCPSSQLGTDPERQLPGRSHSEAVKERGLGPGSALVFLLPCTALKSLLWI